MREPETFSMTDSAITARADVYARAIGQISLFIIGIIVTIYQMWSIRAVALRGWVGGMRLSTAFPFTSTTRRTTSLAGGRTNSVFHPVLLT